MTNQVLLSFPLFHFSQEYSFSSIYVAKDSCYSFKNSIFPNAGATSDRTGKREGDNCGGMEVFLYDLLLLMLIKLLETA